MSNPEILEALAVEAAVKDGMTLIDVRLADDFAAGHLPGATNNCVFEVAFLDRLQESCPEKTTPICVYGANAESHESRMAAEKLIRAGYTTVKEFRGGSQEWKNVGLPIESKSETPGHPLPPAGSVALDPSESRIEWTGRNLLNKHWGKIGLKSGSLTFENGQLTSGECVIDMTDITCEDLSGDPLHDVLIAHLKNDDFFDVEEFPEARLEIIRSEPIEDATPGAPNVHVFASLTLKGIMQPIDFPVAAGLIEDGKAAAQASFSIDRTRWNVLYGSGKFFARLAGHLVNDEIDLQLRMVNA